VNGKVPARIAAACFVGIAAAMTLVQMREEPARAVSPEPTVVVAELDPLPAQLRVCSAMGEHALSSADCRAAWAEKRRRFFGVEHPEAYRAIGEAEPRTSAGAD